MVFIGRTQQVNELRSKIRSCTEIQDAGRRRSRTRGAKEKRRWLWLWIIRQNSLLLFFSVIGENRRGCDWRMSSHTHTNTQLCVLHANPPHSCVIPERVFTSSPPSPTPPPSPPPPPPTPHNPLQTHTHTHNHTKENWACNLILCALLL